MNYLRSYFILKTYIYDIIIRRIAVLSPRCLFYNCLRALFTACFPTILVLVTISFFKPCMFYKTMCILTLHNLLLSKSLMFIEYFIMVLKDEALPCKNIFQLKYSIEKTSNIWSVDKSNFLVKFDGLMVSQILKVVKFDRIFKISLWKCIIKSIVIFWSRAILV